MLCDHRQAHFSSYESEARCRRGKDDLYIQLLSHFLSGLCKADSTLPRYLNVVLEVQDEDRASNVDQREGALPAFETAMNRSSRFFSTEGRVVYSISSGPNLPGMNGP